MRNMRIRCLLEGVNHLLLPATCPACGKVLAFGQKICPDCKKQMTYVKEPFCMKCGKELKDMEAEYCYDCSHKTHLFTRGLALYIYNQTVSRAIFDLKYKNRRENGIFFGEELALRYGSLIREWEIDLVLPVPIYNKKKVKRGYNQAAIVGKRFATLVGVSYSEKILYRQKCTKPLKTMNDRERVKHLLGAFAVKEEGKGRRVLLVDDIYTTGATMDACSRVLLKAGFSQVYFLTVAVGNGV